MWMLLVLRPHTELQDFPSRVTFTHTHTRDMSAKIHINVTRVVVSKALPSHISTGDITGGSIA